MATGTGGEAEDSTAAGVSGGDAGAGSGDAGAVSATGSVAAWGVLDPRLGGGSQEKPMGLLITVVLLSPKPPSSGRSAGAGVGGL